MEWQPIETAPRDGTSILVWQGPAYDPLWAIVYWQEGQNLRPYGEQLTEAEIADAAESGWEVWHSSSLTKAKWPTHWMPLPTPPPAPTKAEAAA